MNADDANEDARIQASVAKNGWHAISVSDTVPEFLYTIGLTHSLGHPDFIILGLPSDVAYSLVTDLIELIEVEEQSFSDVGEYPAFPNLSIAVRPVHETRYEFYFGYAMAFYRRVDTLDQFNPVQLFWPDQRGKFPWERACDRATRKAQPILSEPATMKEITEFKNRYGGAS